jgi:PAS domain S-box-containing protein
MSGVAEPLIQASLLGEAIDQGPVAVFVADDGLRYIAVNEFACSLLGYTREELLGVSAAEVSRDAASEQADFVGHGTRDGQSHLLAKDGTKIPVAYRASETTVAGMRFYVVIAWPTG